MSYHNDPYRVDYLKIYPCLKERPDVLEVLKKSDRKMKYMEVDLKSEQRRKNAENGAESYIPSKEDSLERLVYSAKCQFADDAEGVEDAVIRKDDSLSSDLEVSPAKFLFTIPNFSSLLRIVYLPAILPPPCL